MHFLDTRTLGDHLGGLPFNCACFFHFLSFSYFCYFSLIVEMLTQRFSSWAFWPLSSTVSGITEGEKVIPTRSHATSGTKRRGQTVTVRAMTPRFQKVVDSAEADETVAREGKYEYETVNWKEAEEETATLLSNATSTKLRHRKHATHN